MACWLCFGGVFHCTIQRMHQIVTSIFLFNPHPSLTISTLPTILKLCQIDRRKGREIILYIQIVLNSAVLELHTVRACLYNNMRSIASKIITTILVDLQNFW